MTLPSDLRAHARWARFPVLGLWSRRLTEPPRPCGVGGHPQSCADTHDSFFCGRSLGGFRLCGGEAVDGARLADFRSPPATPSEPLLIGLSRTQRWQVAAALSAAVTITKPIGDAPTSQAKPTPKKCPNPNAGRSSGGSAREGLLSEKPPPSQPPRSPHVSSGGGPGEALLFREAASPGVPLTCDTFLRLRFSCSGRAVLGA